MTVTVDKKDKSFTWPNIWLMSAADFPGLLDVMSVGKAKIKYNLQSKTYKDYPTNEPEEVYFASRAQMNQVEQMASYMAT